jgi:hypothetical protein
MIYSTISFIISVWIFLFFIKNLELLFTNFYSSDFLLKNIYYIFLLEWGVFLFIWWFSWFLSSKKYLK